MPADAQQPCWEPSAEQAAATNIARFASARGLPADYDSLWRWSVGDLEGFWAAIWEHFEVGGEFGEVLADRGMPGASWFPGTTLNYAERVYRGKPDERVAIRHASESRALAEMTWGELRALTARIRAGLQRLGVTQGDRVCAVIPNVPEAVAAFHACASLGATWSSAAPEFGARAICDRFAQIDPKVVIAVDGYRYRGRVFHCTEKTEAIAEAIPDARIVRFGYLDDTGFEEGFLGGEGSRLEFAEVPFEHPLWVLFSSGTTGLPKAIVHGHGGMLLEHLKVVHLHLDARADDRVFWFTTTGWMMWNLLVAVLLSEASIVLYDGDPGGDTLWKLAEAAGITSFGTSPAFLAAQMKSGADPRAEHDLSSIRAVGSTGAPLPPEAFDWVAEHVGDVWLYSTSGGTDLCTAFVGGVPTLPVHRGELQARSLGAAVAALDPDGNAVTDAVGEMVITEPMPCMPVALWGDPDGSRLRETYYADFPGKWRHGDWIRITPRGTAIISGRSDSTINRAGVRIGTSEIYRVVLADDDVIDALVVDVPTAEGGDSRIELFVALREGLELGPATVDRLKTRLRADCSPRHVPDDVIQIPEVPRTLSGKVLEVPVKRILMGEPPEKVVSRDSLTNPAALDWFIGRARAPSPA